MVYNIETIKMYVRKHSEYDEAKEDEIGNHLNKTLLEKIEIIEEFGKEAFEEEVEW